MCILRCLKRIANKTPMLEVLLEALELLKLFGAFRSFRAKDARRFLGIRTIFYRGFKNQIGSSNIEAL